MAKTTADVNIMTNDGFDMLVIQRAGEVAAEIQKWAAKMTWLNDVKQETIDSGAVADFVHDEIDCVIMHSQDIMIAAIMRYGDVTKMFCGLETEETETVRLQLFTALYAAVVDLLKLHGYTVQD